MAGRIRTVKPERLDSESLGQVTDAAYRLSEGLILLADDYGNGRVNPRLLKARVWAYRDDATPETAWDAFLELVDIDYVRLYEVGGQRYFHIPGWRVHQRIDKPSKPLVPGPELGRFVRPAGQSRDPRETDASPRAGLEDGSSLPAGESNQDLNICEENEVSRHPRETDASPRDGVAPRVRTRDARAPDHDHDHDHDHDDDVDARARATSSSTDPTTKTVLEELRRHPKLQAIATPETAASVAGLVMSAALRVPDVIEAIRALAFDLVEGASEATARKSLRAYVTNSRRYADAKRIPNARASPRRPQDIRAEYSDAETRDYERNESGVRENYTAEAKARREAEKAAGIDTF